ncbi:MAG: signal peptide peptidase SppA [Deltaproteobacteria bacterium]|nr:signal peptide peptidase SppA [Deltaproteobacteria bacterium]
MNILKKIVSLIVWSCAALFSLLMLMMLVSIVMMASGVLDKDELKKVVSDKAVGVVAIEGEILSSKKFRKSIEERVADEKIKAIVVRIDSPGGAVGASEEIYRAILKAREKKPVVCSLGNIAASGGLYAAVGCEKIITNESTLSGSIGVVLMIPNFSDVMKDLGIGMTVIKSGKYKDSGSPFRAVSPDDAKVLQSTVDEAYEQFVAVVAKARNLSVKEVEKFADGRIILGQTAVELKLADSIGSLNDAAKIALELSGGEGEPEIIMPEAKKGLRALLDDLAKSKLWFLLNSLDGVHLLYRAFI